MVFSQTLVVILVLYHHQLAIAKSSGEVELIAQKKVGDLVEWARELLEELGYDREKYLCSLIVLVQCIRCSKELVLSREQSILKCTAFGWDH